MSFLPSGGVDVDGVGDAAAVGDELLEGFADHVGGPEGTAMSQLALRGTPWASSWALEWARSIWSHSSSMTTRLGAPVVPPLS
ncbi:hypothetical protein GCM10020000_74640 [Streptomyces olivoverticillatus]